MFWIRIPWPAFQNGQLKIPQHLAFECYEKKVLKKYIYILKKCSNFFQDNPKANRCLGVFGLSLYTQERDLRESFSRFGPIEDLQIVYDHQTGRSRGFAFIYMRNEEDALEVDTAQCSLFRRLSARLQYLQCVSNGDTAVLHSVINI